MARHTFASSCGRASASVGRPRCAVRTRTLICNVALQRLVSSVNARAACHPTEEGRLPRTVKVLECDPELALRVPPEQVDRARDALVAPVLVLEAGSWEPPIGLAERRGLGYLVLGGI